METGPRGAEDPGVLEHRLDNGLSRGDVETEKKIGDVWRWFVDTGSDEFQYGQLNGPLDACNGVQTLI